MLTDPRLDQRCCAPFEWWAASVPVPIVGGGPHNAVAAGDLSALGEPAAYGVDEAVGVELELGPDVVGSEAGDVHTHVDGVAV